MTTAPTTNEAAAGDMLLAVACPSCHVALAASVSLVGAAAQCPLCTAGFIVPELPRPEPPKPRGEMEFAEPPAATIEGEEGVIELRRLTPEEKARRRARRNAIMLLSGVTLLLTIVLVLGRKRPKK